MDGLLDGNMAHISQYIDVSLGEETSGCLTIDLEIQKFHLTPITKTNHKLENNVSARTNSDSVFAKLHQHISFCQCYLLNGRCWGKILCIKMHCTPAKMLLLADVSDYSFANAGDLLSC